MIPVASDSPKYELVGAVHVGEGPGLVRITAEKTRVGKLAQLDHIADQLSQEEEKCLEIGPIRSKPTWDIGLITLGL